MEFKPKYVTVDDFKNYWGKDLRELLREDDNPSSSAERFLYRTESLLMAWIDHNTFRVLHYDHLSPFQLQKFQEAILNQAMYRYKQGELALDSGYDMERGFVADPGQIARIEVCHATIELLAVAGLYNLNIKTRARSGKGHTGIDYDFNH